MIDALTAARLCAATYAGIESFDGWLNTCAVVGGIKGNVIALRGSANFKDWFRDLEAIPVWVPQIGFVHPGFWAGVQSFWERLEPLLQGEYVLTGHSLGAAHAALLAACGTIFARPPAQLILFGCPRPGLSEFSRIISSSDIKVTSYRNGNDPVTELPPLYTPVANVQQIMGGTHSELSVEDHPIEKYIAALQ